MNTKTFGCQCDWIQRTTSRPPFHSAAPWLHPHGKYSLPWPPNCSWGGGGSIHMTCPLIIHFLDSFILSTFFLKPGLVHSFPKEHRMGRCAFSNVLSTSAPFIYLLVYWIYTPPNPLRALSRVFYCFAEFYATFSCFIIKYLI